MLRMSLTVSSGSSSIVSSTFHTTLIHQLFDVLLILVALMVVWSFLRRAKSSRVIGDGASTRVSGMSHTGDVNPEPIGRRILRIGFGGLWLFDALLQTQASMPLGLAPDVLKPAASSSPIWVQHAVNVAVTIWSNHPVTAASAVVWLELGLGLFLLFAPRGRWSRSAGAISGVWGFAIWVFGEAFGGVFGHGLTWVLGAPGAALFYVVAGALVALPERAWTRPRLGRGIVTFMSSFFIAMAVLQAWPGRGFWQGHIRGGRVTGTLTGTIEHLSRTRQPGILSSWVGSFASFDASHGWGVNLLIVVALAGIGTGLLSRNPRIVRWTVAGAIVMCLADWVLIEDLGFLGGVGTNPNSMIPIAFVLGAGYLALVRVPVETGTGSLAQSAHSASSGGWWAFLYPQNVFRAMAALGATAIIAFGALPMALASFNPNADPILAEAFDGPPSITNAPAVPFDLVDQHNQPVSLTSLRGKTVAITFLDPVCTSDCPLIAREFRQTDTMLGAAGASRRFHCHRGEPHLPIDG